MAKNLLNKKKNKALSLLRVGTMAVMIKDILLWRPSNETDVIRKAVENPHMDMEEVENELSRGMAQSFLLLPVKSEDPPHPELYLMGGVACNYALTASGTAGTLLAVTGKLALADAALVALPVTLLLFFGKALYMSRQSKEGSPYMRGIEKKIRLARRKKSIKIHERMRQMIG